MVAFCGEVKKQRELSAVICVPEVFSCLKRPTSFLPFFPFSPSQRTIWQLDKTTDSQGSLLRSCNILYDFLLVLATFWQTALRIDYGPMFSNGAQGYGGAELRPETSSSSLSWTPGHQERIVSYMWRCHSIFMGK